MSVCPSRFRAKRGRRRFGPQSAADGLTAFQTGQRPFRSRFPLPIEWVYKQKNAPVEIIAEFDLWRQIRDWEGSETWVYKPMLSSQRWIKMTNKGTSSIYAKPEHDAKVIAKVEDQVIGKVEKCPEDKDFCLIKFASIEGWVQRGDFFGVYPGETIN